MWKSGVVLGCVLFGGCKVGQFCAIRVWAFELLLIIHKKLSC